MNDYVGAATSLGSEKLDKFFHNGINESSFFKSNMGLSITANILSRGIAINYLSDYLQQVGSRIFQNSKDSYKFDNPNNTLYTNVIPHSIIIAGE